MMMKAQEMKNDVEDISRSVLKYKRSSLKKTV